MADLPELMPNPAVTTGDHQLIAPGAATGGLSARGRGRRGVRTGYRRDPRWAEERKNANAERAVLAEMEQIQFCFQSPRRCGQNHRIVATYEQKLAALRGVRAI